MSSSIIGKGIVTVRILFPNAGGVASGPIRMAHPPVSSCFPNLSPGSVEWPSVPGTPSSVGSTTATFAAPYNGDGIIGRSVSTGYLWGVLGTDPAAVTKLTTVQMFPAGVFVEGDLPTTRNDISAWREKLKAFLKVFPNGNLVPDDRAPRSVYIAGLGSAKLDLNALITSRAFVRARAEATKPILEEYEDIAENTPEPAYGLKGALDRVSVTLEANFGRSFVDVQVGALQLMRFDVSNQAVVDWKFVSVEELGEAREMNPNGTDADRNPWAADKPARSPEEPADSPPADREDNSGDEEPGAGEGDDTGSGAADETTIPPKEVELDDLSRSDSDAIYAMNRYDESLNDWMVFAAKPALPSTWPLASTMLTRPSATLAARMSPKMQTAADTWWADRRKRASALMAVTTIPESSADAAFARDVARGYAGTREQWNALVTKPFTATPSEITSTDSTETGFWASLAGVISGLGTNTENVLKSWGGGGTAAVVGTAAVAKQPTNFLPLAALGLGAILLLRN